MDSSAKSELQPHEYLIRQGGAESGPFPMTRLREMWANGELDRNTKFRRADWSYWGDAEDLLVELEFQPPIDGEGDAETAGSASSGGDFSPPKPAIIRQIAVGSSSFACPHCGNSFRMPNELLGEEIECTSCSRSVTLPPPATLRETMCVCPLCAEEISAAAVKCKHCGEFLDGRADRSSSPTSPTVQPSRGVPTCQQCGGTMKKTRISSGNCAGITLALVVLCIGLVVTFAFFPFGLLVGPLMCLFALFMGGKRSKVWKCVKCGSIVNRA